MSVHVLVVELVDKDVNTTRRLIFDSEMDADKCYREAVHQGFRPGKPEPQHSKPRANTVHCWEM